jgi:PAS domain S-box-containing protein
MALAGNSRPADMTAERGLLAGSESELLDIFRMARNMVDAHAIDGETVRGGLRYKDFLDAIDVAVYTTDADGRITFYNEAAATFWGRRPEMGEEWCGSLHLFWLDGRPMRHDECPMAIALKENRTVRGYEAIVERPDGSRRAFVPYPTPLRDQDGTLIGAVNVLIDVTARREAEHALLASAEALRGSNAVKDEFLGLVSHELRTPVTTIFGNAQILRDRGDALDAGDRESMIGDIADDSERLLAIIENLLLLTRLGSGSKLDLEPQVLNHVMRKEVETFVHRHPQRHVALLGVAEQLIVEADHTSLALLTQNLLTNADKYSPPGTTIDVIVEARDGEAEVVVRDRGIGLSAEEAEALFAPFYRTEAAKKQANGIGVGLAVCKRIAESHGGRVWARPRDGGGSEFGFALPLSAHEAADAG